MNRLLAFSFLAMAMILVGSSVVAGAILTASFPVHLGSLLRFVLASLLLVPMLLLAEGRFPRLGFKSVLVLAGQALCGSVLFTIFLLYGLRSTSPGTAGIITSTTPAVMALLAWMLFGEKPGRLVMASICCCVGGLWLVSFASLDTAAQSLSGNLLVLGAVVVESLFLLLRKNIAEALSPLAVSTLISLFATLFFLPVGLHEALSFDFTKPDLLAWANIVYYAVVVTILAYLCWFAGIVHVRAASAASVTALLPVSSLFFSATVLSERVTTQQVGGCALVLLGIALIAVDRHCQIAALSVAGKAQQGDAP